MNWQHREREVWLETYFIFLRICRGDKIWETFFNKYWRVCWSLYEFISAVPNM